MKNTWKSAAAGLAIGLTVLSLAVVDYATSPETHRGLHLGPLVVEFPKLSTAQHLQPTQHLPTVSSPGAHPSVAPPPVTVGLKAPILGLLDRGRMPSSAFYSVMNGYVVNVSWATLQPTQGGPINGGPIDQAIAAARSANAAGAHLGLKLRVFAGIGAPNWAKTLGGAPIAVRDQNSGASGTVGRFWSPAFGLAYQDLQNKLAAKYDTVPELREVVIARCMTIYDETMIRQISDPFTVANMLAAGYTMAADQACQQQQIQAHAVWRHTRSDMAFNPYQYITSSRVGTNEVFTEQMMSYCRSILGTRCILENNSLRVGSLGGSYSQMYSAMRSRGPNIAFQTATMARVGSLLGALTAAVSLGATSVELPSGYQTMAATAFTSVRLQLAANARL